MAIVFVLAVIGLFVAVFLMGYATAIKHCNIETVTSNSETPIDDQVRRDLGIE